MIKKRTGLVSWANTLHAKKNHYQTIPRNFTSCLITPMMGPNLQGIIKRLGQCSRKTAIQSDMNVRNRRRAILCFQLVRICLFSTYQVFAQPRTTTVALQAVWYKENAGLGHQTSIKIPTFTDDMVIKFSLVNEKKRTIIEGTR